MPKRSRSAFLQRRSKFLPRSGFGLDTSSAMVRSRNKPLEVHSDACSLGRCYSTKGQAVARVGAAPAASALFRPCIVSTSECQASVRRRDRVTVLCWRKSPSRFPSVKANERKAFLHEVPLRARCVRRDFPVLGTSPGRELAACGG